VKLKKYKMKRICNSSNMDGEMKGIMDLEFMTGQSDVGSNFIENRLDNGNVFNEEMQYNASGGLFAGFRERRKEKQAQNRIKQQSKADARKDKAQAKLMAAKAQVEQAKALGKSGAGDAALADALAKSTPMAEEAPKSSKTPLIIGISAVALLGIVGFVIYKSKHKK
jgi:hypothetical protein